MRQQRLRLVLVTAALALLVDVVTKIIAVGVLVPGQRLPLIGVGCVRRSSNTVISPPSAAVIHVSSNMAAWRSPDVG
jgi:hypothetical protein